VVLDCILSSGRQAEVLMKTFQGIREELGFNPVPLEQAIGRTSTRRPKSNPSSSTMPPKTRPWPLIRRGAIGKGKEGRIVSGPAE
jgi:hypothetical protein